MRARRLWADRKIELLLVCAWVASRAVVYGFGVRFDKRELASSVQNIDPELLRDRLAESLWWLHGQPPGYNLFLGLTLKVSGSHWAGAFQTVHLLLSLILLLVTYALGRRLRLPVAAAAPIALLVSLAPATITYENLLFYDFPTLVLVTASALLLARYLDRPTLGRGFAFFAVASVLVLLRTLFQLPWLLLVLALVLVARVPPKRTLAAAAVPIAIVAGVYIKNWALFGSPSTSSWFGMGVARLTLHDVPLADRRRLVAQGKLSRVSLVKPLSPLSAYANIVPPHRPTGIPVLDEPLKSDGERNLNNIAYIEISRRYLHDDLRLVRLRPRDLFVSVKRALELYLRPPTMSGAVQRNRRALGNWNDAFDVVVYGSTRYANRIGVFSALAYLATGLAGLWLIARRRWRDDTTLLFVWVTVVWVTIGSSLSEVGENWRFRLLLDPLVVLFLAALLRARLTTRQSSGP
jgi:hypothetical protein